MWPVSSVGKFSGEKEMEKPSPGVPLDSKSLVSDLCLLSATAKEGRKWLLSPLYRKYVLLCSSQVFIPSFYHEGSEEKTLRIGVA